MSVCTSPAQTFDNSGRRGQTPQPFDRSGGRSQLAEDERWAVLNKHTFEEILNSILISQPAGHYDRKNPPRNLSSVANPISDRETTVQSPPSSEEDDEASQARREGASYFSKRKAFYRQQNKFARNSKALAQAGFVYRRCQSTDEDSVDIELSSNKNAHPLRNVSPNRIGNNYRDYEAEFSEVSPDGNDKVSGYTTKSYGNCESRFGTDPVLERDRISDSNIKSPLPTHEAISGDGLAVESRNVSKLENGRFVDEHNYKIDEVPFQVEEDEVKESVKLEYDHFNHSTTRDELVQQRNLTEDLSSNKTQKDCVNKISTHLEAGDYSIERLTGGGAVKKTANQTISTRLNQKSESRTKHSTKDDSVSTAEFGIAKSHFSESSKAHKKHSNYSAQKLLQTHNLKDHSRARCEEDYSQLESLSAMNYFSRTSVLSPLTLRRMIPVQLPFTFFLPYSVHYEALAMTNKFCQLSQTLHNSRSENRAQWQDSIHRRRRYRGRNKYNTGEKKIGDQVGALKNSKQKNRYVEEEESDSAFDINRRDVVGTSGTYVLPSSCSDRGRYPSGNYKATIESFSRNHSQEDIQSRQSSRWQEVPQPRNGSTVRSEEHRRRVCCVEDPGSRVRDAKTSDLNSHSSRFQRHSVANILGPLLQDIPSSESIQENGYRFSAEETAKSRSRSSNFDRKEYIFTVNGTSSDTTRSRFDNLGRYDLESPNESKAQGNDQQKNLSSAETINRNKPLNPPSFSSDGKGLRDQDDRSLGDGKPNNDSSNWIIVEKDVLYDFIDRLFGVGGSGKEINRPTISVKISQIVTGTTVRYRKEPSSRTMARRSWPPAGYRSNDFDAFCPESQSHIFSIPRLISDNVGEILPGGNYCSGKPFIGFVFKIEHKRLEVGRRGDGEGDDGRRSPWSKHQKRCLRVKKSKETSDLNLMRGLSAGNYSGASACHQLPNDYKILLEKSEESENIRVGPDAETNKLRQIETNILQKSLSQNKFNAVSPKKDEFDIDGEFQHLDKVSADNELSNNFECKSSLSLPFNSNDQRPTFQNYHKDFSSRTSETASSTAHSCDEQSKEANSEYKSNLSPMVEGRLEPPEPLSEPKDVSLENPLLSSLLSDDSDLKTTSNRSGIANRPTSILPSSFKPRSSEWTQQYRVPRRHIEERSLPNTFPRKRKNMDEPSSRDGVTSTTSAFELSRGGSASSDEEEESSMSSSPDGESLARSFMSRSLKWKSSMMQRLKKDVHDAK